MSPTPNANTLIEDVIKGRDPSDVVRDAIGEGISGPERRDVDFAQKEQMFRQLIAQSEAQVPYMNHEYVDQVLSQLKQGASAQEMLQLAQANRDDYAQNHNLGDANFPTWDAIHRAIRGTFTDQLPASVG